MVDEPDIGMQDLEIFVNYLPDLKSHRSFPTLQYFASNLQLSAIAKYSFMTSNNMQSTHKDLFCQQNYH